MSLWDLHIHTTYCDGASTPREIVEAALEKGLDCIGFSGHGYTWFDDGYCMSREDEDAYRAEIGALKAEYAGRIRILCGIEQDYWADPPVQPWDYVIGSVHYVKAGGEFIPVDESPEILRAAAAKYFGWDIMKLDEAYFDTVARVYERTRCDIIGHFDLISKFDEPGARVAKPLLDENDPRYVAAWRKAADALLPCGRPFEINTGAISRGWRVTPYPSAAIQEYLRGRGAKLIWSSDAHSADALLCGFPEGLDGRPPF
jgi:histidinol-phosphatase (PHP family)